MVRIRLFGGLELSGSEGGSEDELLRRPKQLALLVYLLLAEPRGFRRRDEIAALFWPESDHAHARAALRQSLHQLRKCLGPELLLNRGDEEVGVARHLIWCDATAFEGAVEEGRLAEALEQYRGPLLAAFHVSGMVEVERWLDDQRGGLARRALLAAAVLMETAEARGDWEAAAGWARRMRELDPWDENAVRAVMRSLARAGHPAEALRAYESFAVRLRDELDLGVSAETLALEAEIREEVAARRNEPPPGPSGFRGSRSPEVQGGRRPGAGVGLLALGLLALTALALGAPWWSPEQPVREGVIRDDLVAVLPFTLEVGEGLEYLGEGLADLLATRLDGTGPLRAVDGNALSAAVRNEEGGPRDPEAGRALALRFGAGLYILGGAMESNGRIRGKASLYGPGARMVGSAEAVVDSEESLFDLVDELARQILAHIPSLPGDRMARIAGRTTGSFPALKAYLTAETHLRAGRNDSAVVVFERALEADSAFALAWYRMAVARHQNAAPLGASDAHLRALALEDRLSPRDRRLVAAFAAFKEHRYSEAEERYRELLSLYPDEVEGWVFLAQVLIRWGLWTGRSTAEVRETLERALSLDPGQFTALHELAWVSAMEEQFDEGAALARRMLALQPDGYLAPALRFRVALQADDDEGEARLLDELRFLDAPYLNWAQRSAHFSGRLDGRERVAGLMADPARSRDWRALGHVISARVHLDHGRMTAALNELEALQEVDPERYPLVRARFQMRPGLPWDRESMDALGELLEAWTPRGGELRRARLYLLGLNRLRLGRPGAGEPQREALDAEANLLWAAGREREGALARDLAHGLRAWGAAERDDWPGVLRHLEDLVPQAWWRGPESGGFEVDALQTWLRAEALARLDRGEEALLLLAPLGWLWGDAGLLGPRHLRMAELHAEGGDLEAALRHYQRFLALWAECDSELRPMFERGRSGYLRARGQ